MWKRKELKAKARKAIFRNYFACIAVCFIMVFIASEYGSSTQFISDYDEKNVANLKYDYAAKQQIVQEIDVLCPDIDDIDDIDNNEDVLNAVENIADNHGITDEYAVLTWYKIYKSKGVEALDAKEVTFFGTTGDGSNWQYLTKAVGWMNNAGNNVNKAFDTEINNGAQRLATFFDSTTKQHSSKFKMINAIAQLISRQDFWNAIISLISGVFKILFTIFIANILFVGERRFFLENRTYKRTRIGRMGFLFRERTWHPAKTMFIRDLKEIGWMFTIVMIPIKHYEYAMIPFILAENPNIKSKEAFRLSNQMMKKNKWRTFIIDVSFIGWTVLPSIAAALTSWLIFGMDADTSVVTGVVSALMLFLFVNPYTTATKAELYISLRRQAIENGYEFYEELNDKYLDLDLLEQQMLDEVKKIHKHATSDNNADAEIVADFEKNGIDDSDLSK